MTQKSTHTNGPAEFKADILRLVTNAEPLIVVARKLGINDSLIQAWQAAEEASRGDQPLQQEVDRLHWKLRQVEIERDILKKAITMFSASKQLQS